MANPEDRVRHTALATLLGIPPIEVVTCLRSGAEERGLIFEAVDGEAWLCRTPLGDIALRLGAEAATVTLISHSEDGLQVLRDGMMQRIGGLSPELTRKIVWSGGAEAGTRPPNFRLVRIAGADQITASFVRVRVCGENLDSFSRTGLHFRLLLPASRAIAPEWPTVGPNGQTVWPDGEATLHRPVYTIRRIDPAAGFFEFDVFQHFGGRASDWAASVAPGEVVGIMGPSGGWVPEAGWLLLAGDETALPAIARILEGLPRTAQGIAYVQAVSPADRIELAAPPGIEVNWLYRRAGAPSLCEKILATQIPDRRDRFIWFGGEWEEAKLLRQHFRGTIGLDRSAFRIATYWTAPLQAHDGQGA